MGKIPIPADWDGQSKTLMLVCVPDSIKWRAICKGMIYTLTRGRIWDERTGSIIGVQSIGREIWESVQMTCLADFHGILNELKRSNAIFAGETVQLYDESGNLIESLDYTATGNHTLIRMALEGLPDDSAAVAGNVELANIVTELQNQVTGLSNLFTKLEELRTMLETRLTAETQAGNTRTTDIEAILDAIENVLGGTYVP